MKTCDWCNEGTEETKKIVLPSGDIIEVCKTGPCAYNAIYADDVNMRERNYTRNGE